MNTFTMTEMEMLTEGGWEGCFIEDISEGAEVAIKTFEHEDEDVIKFVTVEGLKRIPRYERDEFGHVLHGEPDYLMQFIGVHGSGVREPFALGSGWGIFRHSGEAAA